MALLLGGVDVNVIKIIGRWRSDEVLRYLHVSARSINHNHAKVMRQHGQSASLPRQQKHNQRVHNMGVRVGGKLNSKPQFLPRVPTYITKALPHFRPK